MKSSVDATGASKGRKSRGSTDGSGRGQKASAQTFYDSLLGASSTPTDYESTGTASITDSQLSEESDQWKIAARPSTVVRQKSIKSSSTPQLVKMSSESSGSFGHSAMKRGYIQDIGTPKAYQFRQMGREVFDSNLSLIRHDSDVSSSDASHSHASARSFSPWTPRGAALLVRDKVSPGSMAGSVFNLIIVTLGGGMLSMPYGMREFGLLPSLLLLIVAALLSYFTNDLLLICCDHLVAERKPTHLLLSRACSRSHGKAFGKLTQALILVQIFGTYVSYCVGFGGLLDLVWQVSVRKAIGVKTNIYPLAVVFISWFVIFPLSLMRSMSALRFTSLLGFCCCAYLALVLFGEYFALCDKQNTCFWNDSFELKTVDLFGFKSIGEFFQKLLMTLPLFIFGFSNQQYSLPIYVELTRRSRRRMQNVIWNAHSIILGTYFLSCIFGFLSFLNSVCSNILLNDFNKRADVILAALAMATSMTMTNPVAVFAWRMNFAQLFYGVKQLPTKTHFLVTAAFVFFAMALALLITDISVVFGLLGATIYPLICFVYPAIYFWCIVPKGRQRRRKVFAVTQALVLSIASIASLCLQLYQMSGHNKHIGDCHDVQTIETPHLF